MPCNKGLRTVLVIVFTIFLLASGAVGQTGYKTLHKFTHSNSRKDGLGPVAGVIFDQSGNLYGTTSGGGNDGNGTVFELTPNSDGTWTESVLYIFCSLMDCIDGAGPWGGVTFDRSGNLYGTTEGGGANGLGTVFELAPSRDGAWTESVLYSFAGADDGADPRASITFDQAGNVYGTTHYGGGPNDRGTVFKLAQNGEGGWTESVLHRFGGGWDGAYPWAVIVDKVGNLYGTTNEGGGDAEGGTVFELTSSSDGNWRESVLHRFSGGRDGDGPWAGLILDVAGNLYGTTWAGGTHSSGTVFELMPNSDGRWTEKVVYPFKGGREGAEPFSGLCLDAARNLYGTTRVGGRGNYGVVFKLVPNPNGAWQETVLHSFVDHPGATPFAGVILDAAGNLYGTDPGDSFTTFGSVFEITP
ncbi:MAG: choice-of-anchor tandem repeat GloVer-containing protein [Terriglobales bacterium]